jgi:hypothetical protein
VRHYGARRDANERPIVQALELAGWKVFPLSAPGWPDLVCVRHGQVRLLEVKTRTGKLKPAQVVLHQRMASAGLRVHVVRTPEEAIHAVQTEGER